MFNKEIDALLKDAEGFSKTVGSSYVHQGSMLESVVNDLKYVRNLEKKTKFEIKNKSNIVYALQDFDLKQKEVAKKIKAQTDNIFEAKGRGKYSRSPDCLTFICGFTIDRGESKKSIFLSVADGMHDCNNGSGISFSYVKPGFYFWNTLKFNKNRCGIELYVGFLDEKSIKEYNKIY